MLWGARTAALTIASTRLPSTYFDARWPSLFSPRELSWLLLLYEPNSGYTLAIDETVILLTLSLHPY